MFLKKLFAMFDLKRVWHLDRRVVGEQVGNTHTHTHASAAKALIVSDDSQFQWSGGMGTADN